MNGPPLLIGRLRERLNISFSGSLSFNSRQLTHLERFHLQLYDDISPNERKLRKVFN